MPLAPHKKTGDTLVDTKMTLQYRDMVYVIRLLNTLIQLRLVKDYRLKWVDPYTPGDDIDDEYITLEADAMRHDGYIWYKQYPYVTRLCFTLVKLKLIKDFRHRDGNDWIRLEIES